MNVYASVRFSYHIKASIFISSINIFGIREIAVFFSKNSDLLGFDAVSLDGWFPTLRRN